MSNYKISVSKDGKKFNIVFKADNESIARERVHNEWYSILSLEKITDKHDIGDTFVFEWYKSWQFKHWKIVWNDIFKAYVKLRKDLEYDIEYIYSESEEESLSKDKKIKIIEELKEEYDLYYSSWKKDKSDEIRDKIKKDKDENKKLDNFYLKKELEDVNKLLEIVLLKLEKMISGQWIILLDQIKIEKLKIIYNEIIKLKKSTNISKLREIWELALLKIWNIELQEVEKTKNTENRELLKETNKLLKKLWSKDQFLEKDRDIIYQFKYLLSTINLYISYIKNLRKKEEIDKESHSYIKNLLYLSKYKDYYNDNTKLIVKNFYKFIFNKELKEELFLKRSVIKQNIILLKAKEKWLNISYTFLKKGINKLLEAFVLFFQYLNKYIFIIIILYTATFIIYLNIWFYKNNLDYNYNWVFYFLIAIFIYLFIYLSKNILFLIINFVFLFFIIIFGVINF